MTVRSGVAFPIPWGLPLGMPFSFSTGQNKCLFFYGTLSWGLIEKQLSSRHRLGYLGVFVDFVISRVAEAIHRRVNRRRYSNSSIFCWWGLFLRPFVFYFESGRVTRVGQCTVPVENHPEMLTWKHSDLVQ